MLFSYVHFTIPPILFISGAGTLFFTLYYRKYQNTNNGLSATAISGAIGTVLCGIVMAICMFRPENTCDSTHTFLAYTMTFLSLINGNFSQVLWNYQCCIEIKKENKKPTEGTSKTVKVLSTNFITSLVLLPLLFLPPHEITTQSRDDKALHVPNTMLSLTRIKKCTNVSLHNKQIFNKFLFDLNKSQDQLMYSSDRKSILNDTEEIVLKIYQLVSERVNILNKLQSTANRVPKKVHNNKISNISHDSFILPNITTTHLEIMNVQQNQSSVTSELYDQYFDSERYAYNISFDTTLFKVNNMNDIKSESGGENNVSSDSNGSPPITQANKTLFTDFPLHTITLLIGKSKDEIFCYTECVLQNCHEKAYLLFLLIVCYLTPLLYALILYNKASMLNVTTEERSNNKTLLKSAKWTTVSSILLLTPNFFSLFIARMLSTTIPDWLQTVFFTLSLIHPVLRNIIEASVVKSHTKCKRGAKVHPVEEAMTDTVTEPKSEHSG